MAYTDKNLVITPNVGSAGEDPTITFSGADNTLGSQSLQARIYPTANGTLSFEGSAGQLFSISNELTGTIYSVNDASGLPSIEVFDTGVVRLARYNGRVLIGDIADNGVDTLQFDQNSSILFESINVASQLTSSVATGTAPFVISSTTLVNNLNADLLDGRHVGTSGNTIPTLDGTNTWSNTQIFNATARITPADSQILLKYGSANNVTAIFRNDGVNQYILLSDASTSVNTNWNALRPFGINLTSGLLSSSNGQDFRGGAVFNEGGVDVDFRIESNNDEYMFFVDGGTDRIGIGTSSAQNKLHVQQASSTTNSVVDVLRLDYQSTGTPANGIGVGMEFAVETTANNTEVGAAIEAVTTDITAGNEDFDLVFRTMTSGAAASQVGKLNNNTFQIGATNNNSTITTQGTADLTLNTNAGTNSGIIKIFDGVNNNIELQVNGTGSIVINEAGNAADVRIEGDTDQNLLFIDGSADRVGVGKSGPTAKLHTYSVHDVDTNLSTSIFDTYIAPSIETITLDRIHNGIVSNFDDNSLTTGENTTKYSVVGYIEEYGGHDVAPNTRNSSGVYGRVNVRATSNTTYKYLNSVYGVHGGAVNYSPDVSIETLAGIYAGVTNNADSANTNITSFEGVRSDVRPIGGANTTIDNSYMFRGIYGAGLPTANITNAYGIHINSGTGGLNNWLRGSLQLGSSSGGPTGNTASSIHLNIVENDSATIRLTSTDTTGALDQMIGQIQFYGTDSSAPGLGVKSKIAVYMTPAAGDGSYLTFSTSDGLTNDIERVRIESTGYVGIGTSSPGALLDVRGTVVINEDGGNNDVRIEGDTDVNLFFTDASADRIGIGTSSPQNKLHVQQSSSTTNAVVDVLRLDYQSTSTPANGIGVGMEFAVETTANNTEVGAVIEAVTTDITAGSEDFDLVFKTMTSGATASQVGKINNNTFQIGATGVNASLTTLGTSDLTLSTNNGSSSGTIKIFDGANQNIVLSPNGTGEVQITSNLSLSAGKSISLDDIDFGEINIKKYNGISAWTYTGNSKAIGTEETVPTGIYFKPDGTRMFLIGTTGDDINQYDLSTAWNVSTAILSKIFSVSGQDTAPSNIFFRPDGLRMYVVGDSNNTIYQYTLSAAWDVAVATTILSGSFSVNAQETSPTGVYFSTDGTRMFVCGSSGDDVNQYNLGTAWDITTAVYSTVYSIATYETVASGISFSADGTRMYVTGSTFENINQFNLSTPWSLASGVTYADRVDVSRAGEFIVTSLSGLYVNESANRAYIVCSTLDRVIEFDTSTTVAQVTGTRLVVEPDLHAKSDLLVYGNERINGQLEVTGSSTLGTASVGGTLTGSSAVTFSTTTGTINIGTSQTSGVTIVGGTNQTGTITVGRSTNNHTVDIGVGATADGNTKTVNIGTTGVSGSTTNITLGSSVSGALGSITLNHATQVNSNLVVTGNLTVNGTTTTVDSTTVTVDDPIITLGGDTAPTTDDNKDRGVEFRWHNGTASKLGFFGYDDSAARFVFIPDATNTSEVFSGTLGDVSFGAGTFNLGVVINETGANSDTRIEGDTDVNLFYADASAEFIGIGTNAPGEKLDVRGNLRVGGVDAGPNYIAFRGTTGDTGYTHTYIGERIYSGTEASELVLFKGNDQTTASGPDRIRLIGADIVFDTYSTSTTGSFETVATSANVTTKAILKSDGNFGIGTSTPGSKLAVAGSITELYNSVYYNVVTQVDIGTDPNQVPLNQYLGQLAFVDVYSPSTMRRDGYGVSDLSIDSTGTVTISSNVGSTSTTTGSLVVTGGTGISENLWVGGYIQVDNLRLENNTLSSTNTNGNIEIQPNGTGDIIINDSGNDVDVRIEGDTDPNLFFVDGGNDKVGIGTSTPASKLEVKTAARTTAFSAGDSTTWADILVHNPTDTINAATGIRFVVDSTTDGTQGAGIAAIKTHASNFEYDLVFLTDNSGLPTSEVVRITHDSLVGIGTATPTAKLHISGGDLLLDRGPTTQGLARKITIGGARNGTGNDYATIQFQNYDSNSGAAEYIGAEIGAEINSTGIDGGELVFRTSTTTAAPTERLRILADGGIVINDGSADVDVRIEGNGDENLFFTDGGTDRIGIGTALPQNKLHIYQGGLTSGIVDLLKLEGNLSDIGVDPIAVGIVFKIQDGNNSTNEARIRVASVNDTDYGDNDESATNIIFSTTNGGVETDKMIITGDGRVGINTTNPSANLEISGTAKVTGNATVDGNIVTGSVTISKNDQTTTATTQFALVSVAHASYSSGKFLIQAKQGTKTHITEVLVTHDGTTAIATEYGTLSTSEKLFSVDVDINGVNLRVLITPLSATSTSFYTTYTLIA